MKKGHYHVLRRIKGRDHLDVNYFAENIEMATHLAYRETEMDREDGRVVKQITSREWHINYGDTTYILEITDCFEVDCYQTQPMSKPKGWMNGY